VSGTDIPRTMSDRVYGLLLRAYPSAFRDRFGAGMRYAFACDHEIARSRGLREYARFWLLTIVDTIRSGFAERSELPPHDRCARRRRLRRSPFYRSPSALAPTPRCFRSTTA
jgi:hypothetical protein